MSRQRLAFISLFQRRSCAFLFQWTVLRLLPCLEGTHFNSGVLRRSVLKAGVRLFVGNLTILQLRFSVISAIAVFASDWRGTIKGKYYRYVWSCWTLTIWTNFLPKNQNSIVSFQNLDFYCLLETSRMLDLRHWLGLLVIRRLIVQRNQSASLLCNTMPSQSLTSRKQKLTKTQHKAQSWSA